MATQAAAIEASDALPVTELEPNEGQSDSQSQPRDYEAEARAQGWTDKESFKGDPSRWVDAETFVRRADEVMPLLKKENAHLKREIDQLKLLTKRLSRAEQKAYESALADLKQKQEMAVETGDVNTFRKLGTRIDEMRKDAEQSIENDELQGEEPAVVFAGFREEHPWYDKANLASATEIEINARLMADRLADKYASEGLTKKMPPSKFFAKIAEEVEAKFPMIKAKAARSKPPSDVAGVTMPSLGRNAKTAANLPAEAVAQCKRFYEQGVIKAKSFDEAKTKYAASYQWD